MCQKSHTLVGTTVDETLQLIKKSMLQYECNPGVLLLPCWLCHVTYSISCMASLPFIILSYGLCGIVKCALDAYFRISSEVVAHLGTFHLVLLNTMNLDIRCIPVCVLMHYSVFTLKISINALQMSGCAFNKPKKQSVGWTLHAFRL